MNLKDKTIPEEIKRNLEQLGKSGASLTLFMHIPKTGGSTISSSLRKSDFHKVLWLPNWEHLRNCTCGDKACRRALNRFEKLELIANQENGGKSIYVNSGGHLAYETVKQYTDLLGITSRWGSVMTLVRPAKNRIVSMFRDYWTQVQLAKDIALAEKVHHLAPDPEDPPHIQLGDALSGDWKPSQHILNTQRNYLEDSLHYCDSEGNINGPAWFRAFGEFGGGVPFFMDDVFQGRFRTFRRLVRSKRLRVVSTKNVDALTAELTGEVQPRRRTSLPITPAIDKAISDSRKIIAELAQRDEKYDKFLAKWLKDPDFLQSKI